MPKLNYKSFSELQTKRLLLREITFGDAKDISSLRSNPEVNKYIDRPKETNIEEAKAFIYKIKEGMIRSSSIYWIICNKNSNSLIGTICLWNFSNNNKTAEIGFELIPEEQGKGKMGEAIETVLEFGFDVLGLDVIEAYTHKENISSIKLLEKFNFKLQQGRSDEFNPDNIVFVLTGNKNK